MSDQWIWIFSGGGQFPSGVFKTKSEAENWISKYNLSGVLTCYPLGEGLFDWAVRNGYFVPKKENQKTPEFISMFSCASLEHYHYEKGVTRD